MRVKPTRLVDAEGRPTEGGGHIRSAGPVNETWRKNERASERQGGSCKCNSFWTNLCRRQCVSAHSDKQD